MANERTDPAGAIEQSLMMIADGEGGTRASAHTGLHVHRRDGGEDSGRTRRREPDEVSSFLREVKS